MRLLSNALTVKGYQNGNLRKPENLQKHLQPVSYTHLDVYKRQVYDAARGVIL